MARTVSCSINEEQPHSSSFSGACAPMEGCKMDDQTLQAMSLLMNGTQQALVSLNKCLLNNGALKPGQLSGAIKETFNHAEADWS
jgi:hypothetical protein